MELKSPTPDSPTCGASLIPHAIIIIFGISISSVPNPLSLGIVNVSLVFGCVNDIISPFGVIFERILRLD